MVLLDSVSSASSVFQKRTGVVLWGGGYNCLADSADLNNRRTLKTSATPATLMYSMLIYNVLTVAPLVKKVLLKELLGNSKSKRCAFFKKVCVFSQKACVFFKKAFTFCKNCHLLKVAPRVAPFLYLELLATKWLSMC